jgi:hypothetical protein
MLTIEKAQEIITAIDARKRKMTERLDDLTGKFLHLQRLVAAGQIHKGLQMMRGSYKSSSPHTATISVNGRTHTIQGKSLSDCEQQRAEVMKRYPGATASRCEILGAACNCGCKKRR